MDAHLQIEDVDASGRWGLTSKVLSGLIVVVLGFILVSIISITLDFEKEFVRQETGGLSASSSGEFNSEKPGGGDNDEGQNTGNAQDDSRGIRVVI